MERFYIVTAVGVPHIPGKPGRVRYVLSHPGRPERREFVEDAGRYFSEVWTLVVEFSLVLTYYITQEIKQNSCIFTLFFLPLRYGQVLQI